MVRCDAGSTGGNGEDGDAGANGEMKVDNNLHGNYEMTLTDEIEEVH